MGTRSGDLDAAILPWVMTMEDVTLSQLNAMLNKHSGLYGISGVSSDMREIEHARATGNKRARLAFDIFCYRIRKYVGAYAAAMGGIDAVTFTGGIGENSSLVRETSLAGMEFLGIELDDEANRTAPRGKEVLVSKFRVTRRGRRRSDQRGARHRPRHRAGARRRHAFVRRAGNRGAQIEQAGVRAQGAARGAIHRSRPRPAQSRAPRGTPRGTGARRRPPGVHCLVQRAVLRPVQVVDRRRDDRVRFREHPTPQLGPAHRRGPEQRRRDAVPAAGPAAGSPRSPPPPRPGSRGRAPRAPGSRPRHRRPGLACLPT